MNVCGRIILPTSTLNKVDHLELNQQIFHIYTETQKNNFCCTLTIVQCLSIGFLGSLFISYLNLRTAKRITRGN